ncbi:MAG: enoyl-CoA hydratase [Acidimicrobiia bacterium]|nr:enoyl-CoA hydratase [Acidimicrobiia bacterium]
MIRWDDAVDHVGLLTIDRPERRNALNAELCGELRERLENSHQLRAIVITGEGTAFCAGADIARRAEDNDRSSAGSGGLEHGGSDTFRPAFELLLDAIVDHPAPVIAAINGPALGAGLQLAVACDFRVVADHAKLGIPAARLGIVLSAANVRRLALLVGHAAARDLLLTGRDVDVDEAKAMGLVSRHGSDAKAAALHLARELAALAPLTVKGHKRALNLVMTQGDREAIDVELRALEEAAFLSDDLQEGLNAFGEKREPRFLGT